MWLLENSQWHGTHMFPLVSTQLRSHVSIGQHSSLNWGHDPMCKWRALLTFPGFGGSRNSKMSRENRGLSFCPVVLAGRYYILFALPVFCHILSPLVPLLFFHVVLTLSDASLWPSLTSDEICWLIAFRRKITLLSERLRNMVDRCGFDGR